MYLKILSIWDCWELLFGLTDYESMWNYKSGHTKSELIKHVGKLRNFKSPKRESKSRTFLQVNGESMMDIHLIENSNPVVFSVTWLERNLLFTGHRLHGGHAGQNTFWGCLWTLVFLDSCQWSLEIPSLADMPSWMKVVITSIKIANTTWAALL